MKTLCLNISGLTCENCVDHVSSSLMLTKGVKKVQVDTMSRSVFVKHDDRLCKLTDLIGAIKRVGYQVDGFKNAELATHT